MSGWTLVKSLDHDHCALRLEILAAPDNDLFRYHISTWVPVDESERMYYGDDGYWSSPQMSGLYGSLSECEAAARLDPSWVGQREQNG